MVTTKNASAKKIGNPGVLAYPVGDVFYSVFANQRQPRGGLNLFTSSPSSPTQLERERVAKKEDKTRSSLDLSDEPTDRASRRNLSRGVQCNAHNAQSVGKCNTATSGRPTSTRWSHRGRLIKRGRELSRSRTTKWPGTSEDCLILPSQEPSKE